MNKRKIFIMIIITFTMLFSFKNNVFAAPKAGTPIEDSSKNVGVLVKKDSKEKEEKDLTSGITFKDNDFSICSDGKLFGDDKMSDLLKMMVNVVKIAVPLLLLVLGSLDFAQAIFAQDDGAMKKAQGKFIKRLIIAVVIFIVPSVLKVILGIAHSVWPTIDASLCGIM